MSEAEAVVQRQFDAYNAPIVVDHERVTRNDPEGKGSVVLLCVYEVRDGRIQRASFAFGTPVISGKVATAR